MKKYCLFFLISFLVLSTTKSWAIDGTDTRLLWQPAISKDRIAFIYAEDLTAGCQSNLVSVPSIAHDLFVDSNKNDAKKSKQ